MKRRLTALIGAAALLFSTQVAAQTFPGSSGVQGEGFGGSSAVMDGTVFVGSAPTGWPTGDKPAGVVYVFDRDASGMWTESQRLTASDGRVGDHFGRSVFAQSGLLIIGAPGNTAAYVFEKNAAGDWEETGKLNPSPGDGFEFGGAYARAGSRTGNIAVAGRRIIVTSYSSTKNTGAIHIFHPQGTGWAEKSIIAGDTENGGDGFAFNIAADAQTIYVGAPLENNRQGNVHVYRMNTANGQWEEATPLYSDGLSTRASLGSALAVHEDRLYAGAPFQDSFGGVMVFERGSNGELALIRTISQPEPMGDERKRGGFGIGVAVAGDQLLAAARGAVFAGSLSSGGTMTELSAPDDRSRPGFGTGIAAGGNLLVVGSPNADYEEGVSNLYEWNSAASRWDHRNLLISELASLPTVTGDQIDCEDGKASLFPCDGVDLVSFISASELVNDRGVKMTDIWGWEDPETGKEWVVQGRTDGVVFVDISNPSYPVYVGQLMKTATSPGSAWRDVKVYKDHAFVVADGAGAHGVQIFDLRQLRDVKPEDMPVTFEETTRYDGVASTHNIVINEETGFAYAVGNRAGGETCGGQLHMINVQDPANPTFAGCYSLPEAGGTHDSQCVVYRGVDTDYAGREVCFTSNGSSFIIADVTDKDNPVTLAHTSYPNQAYTHQGWLSEDHSYFYMNDELDEMSGIVDSTRTLIWDVRELNDPTLVKEFALSSRASDHNLYIKGNLMYQSNYQAGLRILDISDPENPLEVANFDTVPYGEDKAGFGGSWSNYPYFRSGIIAVSSRGEGLFLVRKREVDI